MTTWLAGLLCEDKEMIVGSKMRLGIHTTNPSWGQLQFAVCMLLVSAGFAPAGAAPSINDAAPALVLSELGGETFDLSKLRGKVVLVNY